jgi:hypothetical protein
MGQRVDQLIVGEVQWLSRVNERLVTLFVIVVESFGIVDLPWNGTTI